MTYNENVQLNNAQLVIVVVSIRLSFGSLRAFVPDQFVFLDIHIVCVYYRYNYYVTQPTTSTVKYHLI